MVTIGSCDGGRCWGRHVIVLKGAPCDAPGGAGFMRPSFYTYYVLGTGWQAGCGQNGEG